MKVRRKNVKAIVEEIQYLSKDGVKNFYFQADNFFPSSDQIENNRFLDEFVDALLNTKVEITFSIACRVDDITQERLTRLKTVGLNGVFIGIESIIPNDLALYQKRVSPENIRKLLKIRRQNRSVDFKFGYILVHPWTSLAEIARSCTFVKKIGFSAFPFGIYRMKLHPGTALFTRAANDGLVLDAPISPADDMDNIYFRYRFAHPAVSEVWAKVQAFQNELCAYYLDKEECHDYPRIIAFGHMLFDQSFRLLQDLVRQIDRPVGLTLNQSKRAVDSLMQKKRFKA